MVRDLVFKYQGQDYALRPTFELLQKLEQVKPILSLCSKDHPTPSITDMGGYLAILLEASGKKVDRMEAVYALSAPDSSSVGQIMNEVLRAAMPNLFEKSAGKAEPQPAAKKKPATKRKAG